MTDEVFTISERGDSGISDPLADADVVWTRRGTTNVFDTVTRAAAGGSLNPGVGSFTGVQSADGQPGIAVCLMQHSEGATYRYLGMLTDDGQ